MAKSQEVEKAGNGKQVASYEDKYAGEGTFVAGEHQVTPQVRILHAQSPWVMKSNAAYLEGAQPGMILLTNRNTLIKGDVGILFQPCWFGTPWVVTEPGRGGYVSEHPEPLPQWTRAAPPKGNFVMYKTPEGNIVNQVHDHVGLVHIDGEMLPYAIRFKGTGIFVSKRFNGTISSQRTPTNQPAARFANIYRMVVKGRSNQQGEWGEWVINWAAKAKEDAMDLGHGLRMAVESGQARVDVAGDYGQGEYVPEVQDPNAPM